MTRAAGALLAAVVLGLVGGCADWVGDDLEAGDAAVVERPDDVDVPPSTSSTVPPDPVEVRALAVGACADDVTDDQGEQPTVVDAVASGGSVVPRACDGEHRYEVYATVELAAADAGWPGPEQVDEDALRECTARFETYVGVPWDQSSLDLVPVVPDEARWATGERMAWCVLFDLGLEPLEGSASSSGL
jgi:hypothetical protein